MGLLACVTAPAAAADCPGHPDAIGTSRTLVVDPREHRLLGTMQYRETLPLADHEVVLTFDDGPLPRNSNQILEILASQCVKATFFEIGRMAQSFPEGIRKLRDAGHTIGTHTQTHPLTMNRMPIERAQKEIDDGIASVKAALGDDAALAPFLRIPGLMRADAVEDYAAAQGLQIWSADFPADDWRHISPAREYDLAINRIEAKGKGILLLHDIQARTVAALPRILNELKARGYHIVQVVPATPERPATTTEPQQWLLHPPLENVAISHWPKIPNFVFAGADMLPAPALADVDWLDAEPIAFAEPFDHADRRAHGVGPWPRLSELPLQNAAITLPAPEQSLFEMPDGLRAALESAAAASRRAELAASSAHETGTKLVSADPGDFRRIGRGRSRAGHGLRHGLGRDVARDRRHGATRVAGRGTRTVAPAHRGPLKRLVQVKKRNV